MSTIISDLDLELVAQTVKEHMSGPGFDGSHDWSHVQRVWSLALQIYHAERKHEPVLDLNLIKLVALLHDMDDHKYVQKGSGCLTGLLGRLSIEQSFAETVKLLVDNVSWSNEQRNPDQVHEVLRLHPELGIVQDADRLDAIGAVGIGRCFTYGGAAHRSRPMQDSVAHFDEKLVKIIATMKTRAGRKLAEQRNSRLIMFRDWWMEEAESGVVTIP